MREYLLCLVSAAAVTYLATPLARRTAVRWGALAQVRDRDMHDRPTPRLGGLAMFVGMLAALLMASKLPMMREVFRDGSHEAWALVAGAALIVALGVVDDKWGIDAPTKFFGQVLAAGVMALLGVSSTWLPIGGVLVLDSVSSVLVTVLVVVVTVNAINFVDGLDGLAAGIVAIAAIAFFIYSYLLSVELGYDRATLATLISATLAGICLGFLPHNFAPARLFMGDTGSMLIGLLLAACTITLSGQVDLNGLEGTAFVPALLPVIVPIAVVAVPLADLLIAVVRRTRAGRSPFAADKQHLHHRLVEMGHSPQRAVLLMYAWTALVAGTAVALAFAPLASVLTVAGLTLAALVFAVLRPRWGARAGVAESPDPVVRTGT